MGNKSQKKTNQMLEQQTQRANALGSELGNRSNAAYGQQNELRNELLNNYRGLYSGVGEDGGGGGGGGGGYQALAFNPIAWNSTSKPFYTEAMNTGLYDEARKAQAETYATGPIRGMYDALARTLRTRQAGSGINYSSGLERLARDATYAGGEHALAAKIALNKEIDENRFRGAGGVTGLESEERGHTVSERDKALDVDRYNSQAAAAAASRAASGSAADRAYQLAILGRMEGLMPEDLPYIDRQMNTIGLGANTVQARVDETPGWQKIVQSAVPSVIGAGIGAFTGGSGRNTPQNIPEYIPQLSPEEYRYMYGGR